MLTQIDIRNLATIAELHLDLLSGMTVITGETGAGKSILIDAVDLALGSRASSEVVRAGQDKADISITFQIKNVAMIQKWLAEFDFDQGDECIIRRTIHKDGRSRSYINGTPTTQHFIRELSDLLINIHAQHEHQALFRSDIQLVMLDRFACHEELVLQVMQQARLRQTLFNEIEDLKKNAKEGIAKAEFLQFQLAELEGLAIQPDEFEVLESEHKQLSNAENLLSNINLAAECLSNDDEHNALHYLNKSLVSLENVRGVDSKLDVLIENLKAALINVTEVESDLRSYLHQVDLDPERLVSLEERIGQFVKLARKHKVSPQELLSVQTHLSEELTTLTHSDEKIQELEKQLRAVEEAYLAKANNLSARRQKAAVELAKDITKTVKQLALPHAQFNIAFDKQEPFSLHGLEKITFQMTTNLGQHLQPLAKVASGGELSRISLAIHMATAGQHTIPTLVFDEVDVGVSGGTAEVVGKLLRRLGKSHQIICITHSPQVAAQGEHHLLVEKAHQKNATYTKIRLLTAKEKVAELARILGGVQITEKTLAHAREMLERA